MEIKDLDKYLKKNLVIKMDHKQLLLKDLDGKEILKIFEVSLWLNNKCISKDQIELYENKI